MRKITHKEWLKEAEELFGKDPFKWKFQCPVCKHVTSIQDWKDSGAPEGAVAFSCIGRWLDTGVSEAFSNEKGPCNYAGGGLIGMNPVDIDGRKVFEFAPK